MILALDFDGVLHPMRTTTEPKFCRVELLEAWLREHADVYVIISSSWRELHPFDLLQSFFADDIQGRIVGMAPVVLKKYEGPGARQVEIESWVSASAEPGQPWVALDDDPGLFDETFPGTVFCDPDLGLDFGVLARLMAAVDAGIALDRRLREQDRRLAELAAMYAAGNVAWRDITSETGIAFGDVLAELAKQALQLPRVPPAKRPEQVALFEAILQAAALTIPPKP